MAKIKFRWGRWYGYEPLHDRAIAEVPDEPGVYLLAGFPSASAQYPTKIPRCLREDPSGVLYIGKADRLRRRLRYLERAIRGEATNHTAGVTYRLVSDVQRLLRKSPKLKTRFPPEGLKFAYLLSSSKLRAEEDESGALRHYLAVYGELPPLNHQLNLTKWRTRDGRINLTFR